MITIFNRREVLITMDMKRQADARNILFQNNIDYKLKTINIQGASIFDGRRGHSCHFGVKPAYSYEYKIYVHKKDFEKARYLVRKDV